ncbi:MAG: CsgG/HfaB family protein [Acidobacteriia bacterium]|nr:CsgG/HfaB family protein [Terriglobia bacterium]
MRSVRLACLVSLSLLMLGAWTLRGQEQPTSLSDFKYQYKVGVLPFVDNTGSGGQDTGAAIGRAVQAELAHSTELVGRVLKLDEGVNAEDVDGEKAVEMGRARKVDVVLVGTVLEATSEEAEHNAQGPSIFGQTLGGRAHSVKAVVTLQGDLFNSANGKKIDSVRVTGRASETKVAADASTSLGSISTAGNSFQNSPIGKALHNAVGELVKKISADQPKMIRYQPAAEAAPAAPETENK